MQNAVKYSGGAGNVELDLRCDGGNYVIAVSDHGPGIPPEECEAIFQPYWRSKQTEGVAGTGLGLPVARSAARSLGGELRSEEHTSELQSLMRTSYAVFCLKNKHNTPRIHASQD